MLESLYFLAPLSALAIAWCSIVFIPTRWIRWGWLWYAQILVSEWIALSLVLSVLLIFISPWFFWFPIVIICYVLKRTHSLKIHSASAKGLKDFDEPSSLLNNIWPFHRAIQCVPWKSKTSSIATEHLRFPTSDPPEQLCIHIHGGAWKHGDAGQLSFISGLFAELKTEMISINYKKFPQDNLTRIVSSVEETFLDICASESPNKKVVLYGRSAGAHLALMLAAKFPTLVDRVIALYPVTELSSLVAEASPRDILNTPQWIRQVVGDNPDNLELYAQLSPAKLLHSEMPPILIVHGENDPLVNIQQSDLLCLEAERKGLDITYLRFKFATHGFDALWNGLSMQIFRRVLKQFLKKS